MTRKSDERFIPRNSKVLMIAAVCRISGCQNQKELSLDDQADNARELIADLYDGPTEFRIIQTTAKGEHLDRPELEEIEALYRSDIYDGVVYDDLGRLIRGGEAARLLGIGVDHGTRSICIADGIDTADDTWEEDALNACSENVAHNQRTSKRVKQKTMNRFKKFGATARRPIYGYLVPDTATSFDDWQKDPAAERYIHEGARILRETLNGEAVAEYFRTNNVPVGPMARNATWDGTMGLRFYRNPILKGMPQRGQMATVKIHETGKRKSKRNPKGPTYYEAPHIAFFDPPEFDELVALLAKSNASYRRKTVDGIDPRANVPRKRTRFPGQHARCWYCGRTYNWGGNGIKGHLMCSGSHKYHCWNSIHIDGALVLDRVRVAITNVLFQLDGFDEQFRQLVTSARQGATTNSDAVLRQLDIDDARLAKEKENLLKALKAVGPVQMIVDEIEAIKERERDLAHRRYSAQKLANRPLRLPESVADLRVKLENQFHSLNVNSREFGQLLHQIVPVLDIHLVRLLDGGHLLPRARMKLTFKGIAPDIARIPALDDLMTTIVTVDLFDPPQRERIRAEAVRLELEGLGQRQIAAAIEEKPKQAAVQKSLVLHRRMIEMGFETPYEFIRAPLDDYPKMRRHRHSKYRFLPLEGYVPEEF